MTQFKKHKNAPSILLSAKAISAANAIAKKVKSGATPVQSDFDSAIYSAKSVKALLKKDQHGKCAYCGRFLYEVTVDHYRPKTKCSQGKRTHAQQGYYWLAYDWNNMIGSCLLCNGKKNIYFPLINPANRWTNPSAANMEDPLLLNPYEEDFSKHMEYWGYKVYPKYDTDGNIDVKGDTTIRVLGLNEEVLKEARRRQWTIFWRKKKENQWTFSQAWNDAKQGVRTLHEIEYLDMYINQKIK